MKVMRPAWPGLIALLLPYLFFVLETVTSSAVVAQPTQWPACPVAANSAGGTVPSALARIDIAVAASGCSITLAAGAGDPASQAAPRDATVQLAKDATIAGRFVTVADNGAAKQRCF